MEIRHLKYFLACARLHSLTLAAEELYTTQPHVSMTVREMERELGVKLFIRRARGVELTEAGKRIYSYAQNAVKNVDIISSMGKLQQPPLLRIVSNPSSHMAVLLTDYYIHKQEGFHMEYWECGIEEMIARLAGGMADLGFIFAPANRRGVLNQMIERRRLEYVPLLSSDVVIYVRREHPLYGRKSISGEELAALSFIQMEDDFFSVEALLEDLPEFRARRLHLAKVISTNSGRMMIQMLENTNLCNAGSYWLSAAYRQHDFGRITVEGLTQKVSFGYLKYQGRPLLPEMEEFLDFLRQVLDREP